MAVRVVSQCFGRVLSDSLPSRFARLRACAGAQLLVDSLLDVSGSSRGAARCFFLMPQRFSPAGYAEKAEAYADPSAAAWSAKRPVRKKPSEPTSATDKAIRKPSKPDVHPLVAYATADEYNLETLAADIARQGLYVLRKLPSDVPDVLYASAAYAISKEPRELFFFREGTVVFWNFDESQMEGVLSFVKKHEVDAYDKELVVTEQEEMAYSYHNGNTRLLQDEVRLKIEFKDVIDSSEDASIHGDSLALDKYSVSNALSLSVKLSIWEASLNRYIDSIEFVTEDLKSGNKLQMSRRDVLRKTGELFALRHLINLSSDLLDTPDFYWDREPLERLYQQTCAHLNINRRTKVMNEKLSHCCDLTGLLREHLDHNHSSRLEWMIIVLIMIEILFELIHYADKYRVSEETTARPT